MRRQRRQDDTLERMLGQRRQNQQDDTVRITVRFDDDKTTIIEQIRRIERVEDPQNPGVSIPYTVTDMTYSLDENGNPLGNTENAGGCRFGHIARIDTLSICARCRRTICRRHTITVGRKTYCRGGFCLVVGVTAKFFWGIFRCIAFCVMSILGIHGHEEPDNPEETPPVPGNRVRREMDQTPGIRRE